MEGSLLQITPTPPNPTNQCVCLAGKQEVECKFVFNPARTSGDTQQHGLSKLANAWSPKSNVQFSVKYLICMLFMLSGRVNADSQFQRPQDRLILRPGHCLSRGVPPREASRSNIKHTNECQSWLVKFCKMYCWFNWSDEWTPAVQFKKCNLFLYN